MHLFEQVFGRRKVFVPVIHLDSTDPLNNGYKNVETAVLAGADGAVIIDMNNAISLSELCRVQAHLAANFPGFPVGINPYPIVDLAEVFSFFLGHSTPNIPFIWTDWAGVDHSGGATVAERQKKLRDQAGYTGLVLGGVAHKGPYYDIPEDQLGSHATIALRYIDAVMTTGAGTGVPIDLGKLELLRLALGDEGALAASGFGFDLAPALKYVDGVFANTPIKVSPRDDDLDGRKTEEMARIVHGYEEGSA